MDTEEFPPPPPEMLADSVPFAEEDEGEPFDFDDDDMPEPPATSQDGSKDRGVAAPPVPSTAPSPADSSVAESGGSSVGGAQAGAEGTSAAGGNNEREKDLPPPPSPPPLLDDDLQTDPGTAVLADSVPFAEEDEGEPFDFDDDDMPEPPPTSQDRSKDGTQTLKTSPKDPHPPPASHGSSPQGKVNPYSVIDITPIPPPLHQLQNGSSSSTSSIMEPKAQEEGRDHNSSPGLTSGYSVPVPCGYATPSGVPLITPAYTTPVIIRHLSVDEDVTVLRTYNTSADSVFSEEYPPITEEDALAKWASDPANTAWMESPDEVIYDDVPRENSDSNTDPDEMIYDDVEFGEEGGCSSSPDNGWSSSEFESYDEASEGEGGPENGLPNAFMRGKPPQKKNHLVRRCILESILESEKNYLNALKRILEHYEKPLSQIEPRLLSDRKLKMIFYRVREILQCHFLFQIALASRVAEWDGLEMIGDVFVASFCKSMVLDAYSEYVNNFSTAMAVVRKTCISKPGFLDFLKHRQETSSDRMTLYGLMMKPIQRFPQFILLLQDMLKNTPVGHADRLPLQMALTELETLAEKLNEKKREADQRCEIRHISKAMNERYLNKLLSHGSRYLIRSDDMVETVYSERGEILKTKERRLFLLNDVLMCATPNLRCQDGSGSGSGSVPLNQKFLLKWSVPLSLVEVLEFGSSEDAVGGGGGGRLPAPHSGEKVVINAKPNKLYMGPGQLYQDLQNLIHDLSLVHQISSMISSLKGNYQNVNSTVAQDWVSGLQRLILKKEEEIRAADRCRIQLQLPGKQDKTGRPTYFSAVFNTHSPAIKQSWISNLQMAKLALEEDNVQGWFFAEDDGNQIKKQKHPLLLRQIPVIMSKLQEFKIECAVHNPEPFINTESTADRPAMGHGCVWVASCTNQMGQIAIVAMQNSSPKVTECFNVESRILCMAYVPAEQTQENDSDDNRATARDAPSVCLGMEEGSIIVYRSSQRSKKVRLQHFFTPEKSTVTSLVYRKQSLFVGLVSGSVAVYSRSPDGLWDNEKPKLLKLGVLPVKAMLAVEEHLWASSGGQVFIICTHTHCIQRHLEAHQEEGMVVSHMVAAGVGIWIAFSSGSTLRLFHTETLEHLQDINIATPVHSLLPGNQRVLVSSLLVCHGLLLVGTNLGVTVALSVPRLQGIPKVTGRGMVSLHAHNGPVKFLVMAAAVCNHLPEVQSSSPPSLPQPSEPQNVGGDRPPPDSATPSSQGHGVWLGEAGCTAMALQDSLSSSSCGSLAPSQGSLEHGPEDGALYDTIHDAAHHQRARRSSKVDVSSLLVVSGGLGHRRVTKKTKPSRHEDNTSTIMIWQIPLLSM
uniref:Rho guanine nucleotide exchange factor 10 n=1 Tax=Oryzias sinensis TaxID=183150 RepID=A0A8C7ZVM7_9TELE